MCGRIVWRFDPLLQQWVKDWLEDEEAYQAALAEPAVADDRFNINPGSTIPVARVAGGRRILETRKWAFPMDGRYIFNTRIETAFTSPMWQAPMRDGRCLVPVTGFYEWRRQGKAKAPFFVHRADEQPMILAGVSGWREHRGEPTPCVSIVTCPPVGVMARLHDRMPVVLEAGAVAGWAAPETPAEVLRTLVNPDPGALAAYPVDPRVGDQSNDGPDLIKAVPTLGDPLA